jgi:hypothetical protein
MLMIVSIAGLLSACAQQKTMYTWKAYQPSVHAYLQDDGADHAVQAEAMQKNIETASADGSILPPGFRAHLGMLYLKMGDGEKAVEQFLGEKTGFPESSQFMDFLLRNAERQEAISAMAPPVQTKAVDKGP